jgi:hypothetical protein
MAGGEPTWSGWRTADLPVSLASSELRITKLEYEEKQILFAKKLPPVTLLCPPWLRCSGRLNSRQMRSPESPGLGISPAGLHSTSFISFPANPRFQSREFDPMSQFCDRAYSSSKQPDFIQLALSLSPQPATFNPGNLVSLSLL